MKKINYLVLAVFLLLGYVAKTEQLAQNALKSSLILIANFDDVMPPAGDFAPGGVATVVPNPDPVAPNESPNSLRFEKEEGTYKLYGMNLSGLEIPFSSIESFEFQVYQDVESVADAMTHLFLQFTAGDDLGNVEIVWSNNTNLEPGWNTLEYSVNQPDRDDHVQNLFIFPNMDVAAAGVFFFDNIKIHLKTEQPIVDVTGVTLNINELTLAIGQTGLLIPTIQPANATNQNVTWSAADDGIVNVQDGIVTGIGTGVTTITVTTVDGGFTATCEVTVTDEVIEFQEIITNWDDILPVQAAGPGVWQFFGGNASLDNIIDNPHPDDVNPAGKVLDFTRSGGTWQIFGLFYEDGFLVTPNIHSIEVLIYSDNLQQVFLQILRVGGDNLDMWPAFQEGQWNRLVIPVSDIAGDFITNFNIFLNPTSEDAASAYIGTVKFNTVVSVTGITIDITQQTLNIGESFFITPVIEPADADNKEVVWETSDASVATVSSIGQVIAVGAGTADIMVTTVDGDFTATCVVTVLPTAVTGVGLDQTAVTMYPDETVALVATITPGNAANQEVAWSSSNEAVATVDASGTVTAVDQGTATITVTTDDGGFTATCEVTVLSTNIDEVMLNQIAVFPNPIIDGNLTIDMGPNRNGELRIKIYNITGNLTKSFKGDLSEGRMMISTSLIPGVYLIRLEMEGISITKKLLVR